ncbi:spore germination protein KA [Anaerobacterium chartisolvens]|uniref:Spore germination protein KA n=1 Tax=Anaerobacterium chartisolvens TaxID=1297424 RepID=A0A369BJZ7_9FIRM|nr:spore germination protein [Anaerobacterium chartisolvens]RCX20948.1 spore germination protein KA [Anaerobacterium chartisolvens]
MFNYLSKIIRYNKAKKTNIKEHNITAKRDITLLSPDLKVNLEALRNILGTGEDIIMRTFSFGGNKQAKGALIFVDGMVDKDVISSSVMKPLMYDTYIFAKKNASDTCNIDIVYEELLSVSDVQKISTLDDLLDYLLSGSTILLVDGSKEALVINAKKWERRSVEKPETENVVRGPREGFTENLRTNTTLLRRKIRNPDLRFETFTIGEKTRTDVSIAYIKDIVNPKLIHEIKKRLSNIQIDAVLESGYIEAFIEDAPYSIFSTVGNSEKPDTVAAKILEGRAAILVEGTPFVLTVPMLFIESFQSAEDYYSRPFFASVIRIIRFLAYFITILAPAAYVALSTFHQELIPTLLLFTMTAGNEGVPFPSVVEATIMIIIFEILREAGVRLPRPIGSAVSIVGALVIGESAVSAGLIGNFMVIIVALTAISSFAIPAQTDSGSILRYFLLILAGVMGGFGIIMGLLVAFIHMVSLRSFGTPYLSPIAPFAPRDMKDTFIRMPLWTMTIRPRMIGRNNSRRQNSNPPSAPNNEENDSQN